jgi:hypothetical protein
MNLPSINWLAILVCVVVSMISGSLWYNPKTFFPIWWKGIGKTEKDDPGTSTSMGLTWTLTILSSLVQAIFISLMVSIIGNLLPGGPNAGNGARIGFLLWAGIIAPTYLVNKLFAGHGFRVWAIEVGNHLINFLMFGFILGMWR